jgi:hypothetical protein
MFYNVGSHDSDDQAEKACYDAGLGRSGIGDSPPPEPGIFYFPKINGLRTGWPRVWGLKKSGNCSNDYEWIDLNPGHFVKYDDLKVLENNSSHSAHPASVSYLDIDYHPGKGPETGPHRGEKLNADYHGQIARQWQHLAKQVRFWIAKDSGDMTEWWPVTL